jgi:hypothetical protein
MTREAAVLDPAQETNRLLRLLSEQVAELSKWKASQEEAKKARIGKIFDEINGVLKKNCCTHEEAIGLLEMMKAQVTSQYTTELNKD